MAVERINNGHIPPQLFRVNRPDNSRRSGEMEEKRDVENGVSSVSARQNVSLRKLEEEKETGLTALEKFMRRGIRLEVDTELKIVIVKIVDSESGEVVKQIPPEEMVKTYRRLRELFPESEGGGKVKKEA